MNHMIREEGTKKMLLEVSERLIHKVESLSPTCSVDPDNSTTTFSVMLANVQSLDGQ